MNFWRDALLVVVAFGWDWSGWVSRPATSEIQTQSDRHGRFWTVTVQGSGWSNTTRYYWPTNSEKVVLSAGDKVHLNASQGWLWLDVHNLSSTQGLALNAALL